MPMLMPARTAIATKASQPAIAMRRWWALQAPTLPARFVLGEADIVSS